MFLFSKKKVVQVAPNLEEFSDSELKAELFKLKAELDRRHNQSTSTWGVSLSQQQQCRTDASPTKTKENSIRTALPREQLKRIQENMEDVYEQMITYSQPPEKNETNEVIYSEISKIHSDMSFQMEVHLNPINNYIKKTPSKMLSNRGRQFIDDNEADQAFYIYTVGFNHPNDGDRSAAYDKLTAAIASEEYSEEQQLEFYEGEIIRKHTFFEWRYHGKKDGEVSGSWGPGPPWKPENFQMIWENGKIPIGCKHPDNIRNVGKTWAKAYGSIGDKKKWEVLDDDGTVIDDGDYDFSGKRNFQVPKKWKEKFIEVFEIRHLRKLGMSYQDVWKREKQYTDLAAMVAGKGASKSFHSLRAFGVSWPFENIQIRQPKDMDFVTQPGPVKDEYDKLMGRTKGTQTGNSSTREKLYNPKILIKAKENLRRLTANDIEHSYHKDFFEGKPFGGFSEFSSLLNKWEEHSATRFKNLRKEGKSITDSLEYNTKYEYIFNLSYEDVQKICNNITEGWLLQIEKTGSQTATKANNQELFKYKIDSIHWLQEDLGSKTHTYRFVPILGETLEGFGTRLRETFSLANIELDNKRVRDEHQVRKKNNRFHDGGTVGGGKLLNNFNDNLLTEFIKLKF